VLLSERERRRDADRRIDLPTRIPASRFKDFVSDPAQVAAQLRRPMPQRPFRQTQLGTIFHSWVEERASLVGSRESIDSDALELDHDPAEAGIDTAELQRLKAVFERSAWASARPEAVEIEIHYPLDGQIMICKIDAVYPTGTGFQIVDWKTGRVPRDAADLEQKQLQLALYRLAFAHWKGIDPDAVDAVFYYVSEDRVIRPERLYSEDELVSLMSRIAP
jgi:DNA helicase-2/ATP-dependent DNA helicase PcrA